jgi:hypothetical protein
MRAMRAMLISVPLAHPKFKYPRGPHCPLSLYHPRFAYELQQSNQQEASLKLE